VENDVMKQMRLDKYLAEMSVGSRSQVKQMIKKGRIFVNGALAKKPELKVSPGEDLVEADGRPVAFVSEEYIMLHKPAGVVSATKDLHDKTVLDLLKDQNRKDIFPEGRLDKDTEGLLLMTNDGELAHKLLSPSKHVDKTYYAKIQGQVTKEDQEKFQQGLDIGEKKKTLPADLVILSSGEISEIEITIREGKFHQIKRMFEAVDKKVIYLKRISFGSLMLDSDLKPGEYRNLTEEEIHRLKEDTNE
jgi:16S rRNA pseudouridine516 synthase